MPAERPAPIHEVIAFPKDDGLFGPQSVSWQVFSAPASGIGIQCALLLQALLPRVVRLFDQASSYRKNPELRARLTREYGITVTFGDTERAEAAGEALRRIHHQMRAVDFDTGKEYGADEPDLLLWVHNTSVWGMLRSLDQWGPRLTPEERDRFVDEQRTAARLVGIDPAAAPRTWAELDQYIRQMQPKLAYTMQAMSLDAFVLAQARPFSATWVIGQIARLGAFRIMTEEQRDLYHVWWTRVHDVVANVLVGVLVFLAERNAPYAGIIPRMREEAIQHAFGWKKGRAAQAPVRPPGLAPSS